MTSEQSPQPHKSDRQENDRQPQFFGILAVLGVLMWLASAIDTSGLTTDLQPSVATPASAAAELGTISMSQL